VLASTLGAVTIEEDDPREPFRQAADALREDFRSGRIKPGQRLDSVRQLADRFRIAPTTVQRALAVLREEGLLTTTRRGSFAQVEVEAAGQADGETAGPTLEDVLREISELRTRVERLESAGSHSADQR
jgi:DNA-binding transcriptional regulator YhcF (GntR family)